MSELEQQLNQLGETKHKLQVLPTAKVGQDQRDFRSRVLDAWLFGQFQVLLDAGAIDTDDIRQLLGLGWRTNKKQKPKKGASGE